MRLTETYFTESNDFIYPVLTDFFWTSVFLILFFYAVHKLLIARFLPHNKKAVFQNSPVSADVLLQEESHEVVTNEKFTFPARVIIVILLIAFLIKIASYWFFI